MIPSTVMEDTMLTQSLNSGLWSRIIATLASTSRHSQVAGDDDQSCTERRMGGRNLAARVTDTAPWMSPGLVLMTARAASGL